MIDNEREAKELLELLKQNLPLRAYATARLVKAIRHETDIKANDAVEIDSVLYLGDEGGIACGIQLAGGKSVVVTSLTHLRISHDHPLAERIYAYQLQRARRLGIPVSPPLRANRAATQRRNQKRKRNRKARR